jgi:hypothetical protein
MATPGRFRRIAVIALVSLVALLAIAWFGRNIIATTVARSVASRLLGVQVQIDSVNLDVFGLGVDVNGLIIDNPAGWGAPHMLEAKKVSVRVAGESTTQRLVVDLVELSGIKVWFIRDGKRNNVSEIIGNLSGGDSAAKPEAKAAEGPSTDLLIRLLVLDDVEVHYTERAALVGEIPVAAKLKRVEVKDINARTAGKDLAEKLVGQVFEATMLAIVSESGGKLPAVFGNAVQGSIEAGGRIGTEAIKGIQDATKGAGDAVGGLLQGISDAFGGKDKGKDKGKAK